MDGGTDGWMDDGQCTLFNMKNMFSVKEDDHSLYSGDVLWTCCAHTDDIDIHSTLESFCLPHDCFRQARAEQNQDENASEDSDLYRHLFGLNV